jgi:DNA-binding transcriptional LysR family regulator
MSVKLNALQAFVAAIEDGSLRSAGRRLGYSQPALTKMIKDLECELAAPLLVRNARGVIPTEQGRLLLEHARRVQTELVQARQQIAQLGGVMRGELRISASAAALARLVPQALRSFAPEFPGIRLRVTEECYAQQIESLREGASDIAITAVPAQVADEEFQVHRLMTSRMAVVVRRGSALARASTLREFADANWVHLGTAAERSCARSLFDAAGLDAQPVDVAVNTTLALLSLVTHAGYVGWIPVECLGTAVAEGAVQILSLPVPELPIKIGALVRAHPVNALANRYFMAHLHRSAQLLSVDEERRLHAA